jgi:hypothetical protein
VLEKLAEVYGRAVTPEDLIAYVYTVLAHPAFTRTYARELESRELRIPFTRDYDLFRRTRGFGARLLWLHTYGQRFVPGSHRIGEIPQGEARCTVPVPANPLGYPRRFWYNATTKTIHIGDGEFAPVALEVYQFEVSGLKVVQSWLNYRMKNGAGRKSSFLNDIRPERWTPEFTTELIELLWVLQHTTALYAEQEQLFSTIVAGPCFDAADFPKVSDRERQPPSASLQKQLLGLEATE